MKLLVLLAFFVTTSALAQPLGIGAMIGSPTGLSGKYWLNESHAIDGGLGLSLGSKARMSLHSDYLFHKEGALIFKDDHPLDLYYGIGGRMKFADDIRLGVRLPVGVVYNFEGRTADMFGEIAPIVDFLGRVGADLHLAVGARYYFK